MPHLLCCRIGVATGYYTFEPSIRHHFEAQEAKYPEQQDAAKHRAEGGDSDEPGALPSQHGRVEQSVRQQQMQSHPVKSSREPK